MEGGEGSQRKRDRARVWWTVQEGTGLSWEEGMKEVILYQFGGSRLF